MQKTRSDFLITPASRARELMLPLFTELPTRRILGNPLGPDPLGIGALRRFGLEEQRSTPAAEGGKMPLRCSVSVLDATPPASTPCYLFIENV